MAITRWQPGHPVLSVRDAMNQLFDDSIWFPTWRNDSGNGQGYQAQAYQAPMDVWTDGDTYCVEVALPGLTPDQIDIQMVGHTLTISGEAKYEAPDGCQYLVRQRPWGKFQTSITLPEAADAAQARASFEHGVLRLEVPKSEAAKPRRIALNAGT